MLIKILCISKTTDPAVAQLVDMYSKRLLNYTRIEWKYIVQPPKASVTTPDKLCLTEWEKISKNLTSGSWRILLDEGGKEYTSLLFAERIRKIGNGGHKLVEFIVGGAYGFPPAAYKEVNEVMALSKMTFTHQMIRAILAEQLYRAHTILKGEKYHH